MALHLLSAAQSTDQGEESVVLVVLVVVGDHFQMSHMQFFEVCKIKNSFLHFPPLFTPLFKRVYPFSHTPLLEKIKFPCTVI